MNKEKQSINQEDKTMSNTIEFNQYGDLHKTNNFLERCLEVCKFGWLDKYGRKGVEALQNATPIDTGLASSSWSYEIVRENGQTSLVWYNDDVEGGANVVILLEYGHGTKSGTFVEGRHFIEPAIQPIFDEIAEEIGKEMNH